jgi:hypothetical protein
LLAQLSSRCLWKYILCILTCPWCEYEMAKVPYPSAIVELLRDSLSLMRFNAPSTTKYSTAPLTPASISVALMPLNIVVPTGVDFRLYYWCLRKYYLWNRNWKLDYTIIQFFLCFFLQIDMRVRLHVYSSCCKMTIFKLLFNSKTFNS